LPTGERAGSLRNLESSPCPGTMHSTAIIRYFTKGMKNSNA